MWFEDSLKIKEDIEASYHMWEIYALEKREVVDEIERARITNRMMYVLTGEQQYQAESLVAGAMATLQKRKEKAFFMLVRFATPSMPRLGRRRRGLYSLQLAATCRCDCSLSSYKSFPPKRLDSPFLRTWGRLPL